MSTQCIYPLVTYTASSFLAAAEQPEGSPEKTNGSLFLFFSLVVYFSGENLLTDTIRHPLSFPLKQHNTV